MSNNRIPVRLDALGSTQDQPTNPTESLGMQLDVRYQQTQNPNDLDAAVKCCQLAARTTAHVDYAARLDRLVGLFDSRFQYLDQNPRREMSNNQLSQHLDALESSSHAQDQHTNSMDDVDEAVRLGFLALRVAVDPALLENFGRQLDIRYEQTQDIDDLNLAIEYSRLAIKMTAHDHPDYKTRLDLLAGLLDVRFQSTGFLRDLDNAIQLTRNAGLATSHNDYEMARYWFDRGERLGRRFGSEGTIVDLNDAIWFLSLALRATTEFSPFFVDRLVELAFNSKLRYDTLAEIQDLQAAISLRQRALQATDDQHELRLDCLRDLGSDLEARYRHIGEASDIQEAITLAHNAMNTMVAISPNYYLLRDCFYELGTKLGLRYEKANTIDDLNEAIIWSRKAVGAIGARIEVFRHLEHLLTLRYTRTHQINDSEEASK
ncbi:hypothetical protein N7471_010729 [Penicillium samsonianum]|uniref:uncharacterized protein n=1 Tax=Penicillium samsonianum TaxID=1882272 RepID=UPI0025478A10|nr:uncharacterized protein N7471_010729 [Penicillium samsonianum]KAJ6126236.1 hypothetical protein N7471_010729 [Penicillium samsonianum]